MIAGNITKIQKKCNRLQVDLNEEIHQIPQRDPGTWCLTKTETSEFDNNFVLIALQDCTEWRLLKE